LRYGEDFVLLAKGKTVLQGKIDALIFIGTCYGTEKNVDKTTIRTADCDRSKKLKNVEYFNRFGCLGQYLHVIMYLGFPWQKQDSKRRRLFLPALLN
jgi:hypothetical protein